MSFSQIWAMCNILDFYNELQELFWLCWILSEPCVDKIPNSRYGSVYQQGKKVCKTTAVTCYDLFWLVVTILFLITRSKKANWSENKKLQSSFVNCGVIVKLIKWNRFQGHVYYLDWAKPWVLIGVCFFTNQSRVCAPFGPLVLFRTEE